MKKAFTLFLLTAIIAASCFAGPVKKRHIPADAKWVAHFNLDSFLSSELWNTLKTDITPKQEKDLKTLKDISGINPLEDIAGVTVYGTDSVDDNALVVLYGNFDSEKMTSLLELSDDYSKSEIDGTVIHHWTDQKDGKKKVGAFTGRNQLVISGNEASVANFLSLKAGKVNSIAKAKDCAISKLIDSAGDAMMIVAADKLDELAQEKKDDVILQNSSFLAMLSGEKDGNMYFDARLTASNEESAEQIEQIYSGFKALALLKTGKEPETSAFIKSASFKRDGKELSFRIKYPSAKIAELIRKNSDAVKVEISDSAMTVEIPDKAQ